jgi:DNA-3-methyladenine glycosylase
MSDLLDREELSDDVLTAAVRLLGCVIEADTPEGTVGVRLVEVEAYRGADDPASHSFRGRTTRNAVMFGPPGHLYVYLIYGLHHCLNVVAGPGLKPEAVLVRALELDEGVELARQRRGGHVPDRRLASGPGNVGRALGVDRGLNGADLLAGPVLVEPRTGPPPRISRGPRIGVAYAGAWAERPLRFWITDDPHVSRR